MIQALDHLQLAMPAGQEEAARRFYAGLLGLPEIPKPAPLAQRGGCWFDSGAVQVHLGVEADFQPARKAHPCFLVGDLPALQQRLEAAGVAVTPDAAVEGVHRFYAADPFGNRLEFLQDGEGFSQQWRQAVNAAAPKETEKELFEGGSEPIRLAEDEQDVRQRHESNRQGWNQGAQRYRQELQEALDFLRRGQSSLHLIERRNLAKLGPLSEWCKTAIHLQCASGQDTLSLWNEGVQHVAGVDISDVHIENARWLAGQLHAPAEFYRCDVLDTPHELDGTADLVYTGRGALCWLHDLPAWGRVVARLLKPGGVVHVLDDHPFSWLFDQGSENLSPSGISYFNYAERNTGWSAAYIGDLGLKPDELASKYERLWPISTIFQALTGAGLVVELFGEYPDEYWDGFPNLKPELKQRIPMTFAMLARKPQ